MIQWFHRRQDLEGEMYVLLSKNVIMVIIVVL